MKRYAWPAAQNKISFSVSKCLLCKLFEHDQYFSGVRVEPHVKEGESIWRQQRA